MRLTPLAVVMLLVPIASTAGATSGPAQVAAEPAAPRKMVVISHNVERRQAAIDRALDEVRTADADVLALQEVCSDQLAALRAKFGAARVSSRVRVQDEAYPNNTCAGTGLLDPPQTLGEVVIWLGGGTVTQRFQIDFHDLPDTDGDGIGNDDPRGREYGMVCLRVAQGITHVACSVHNSAAAPNPDTVDGRRKRQQFLTIRDRTTDWTTAGQNVILAGDFNAQPSYEVIDPIYHNSYPRGAGRFDEVTCGCRTNSPATTDNGRKIDLIFFSHNRFERAGSSRIFFTSSDHHMVLGTGFVRD